jgi:hypothetical protein
LHSPDDPDFQGCRHPAWLLSSNSCDYPWGSILIPNLVALFNKVPRLGCLIWCTILWLASINMKICIMNPFRAIYHVSNVFRA